MADKFKSCSVKDCNKNAHHTAHGACGYCRAHYHRLRNHGDALGGQTVRGEPMRYFLEVVLRHIGNECLIWPYAKDSNGYGHLSKDGRAHYVTRLVCEAIYGPPPTSKHQAAHSCGNGHGGCCNPAHLRWATVRENHLDKKGHGTFIPPPRHAGRAHPQAKFSEEQIALALDMIRGGSTVSAAAKAIGTSCSVMSQFAKRNSLSPGRTKLTKEDAEKILAMKGSMSQREIAKMFGVGHAAIGCIHRGQTWRNTQTNE